MLAYSMSEDEDSPCLEESGSLEGAVAADLVVGTSRPWVDHSRRPSEAALERPEIHATLQLDADST